MPAVTIIVPVYNAEQYLRQAIESVLAQSNGDWEMILVDDGSTDSSNKICKEYQRADNRIKLIEKANEGPSAARNDALNLAKGEYLFFLDADDELFENSIEHLLYLSNSYQADIVIGRMLYAEHRPLEMQIEQSDANILDAREYCKRTLYQKPKTDNSVSAKLFRRNIFDNLRFRLGRFEDLDIFPKILLQSKRIVVTDALVYFYRKHSESFINTWSDGRLDILDVTTGLIEMMKNEQPELLPAAWHRRFSALCNVAIGLSRHNPSEDKLIEDIFDEIKSLRGKILFDRNSRLKNRVAAFASYAGLKFIKKIIQWSTK